QIDVETQQPNAGDVRAPSRRFRDDHQSDYDLDDTDDQHECVAVAAEDSLGHRAEVLVPIHELVEEFIQTCEERPYEKCDTKRPPRGSCCAIHCSLQCGELCNSFSKLHSG